MATLTTDILNVLAGVNWIFLGAMTVAFFLVGAVRYVIISGGVYYLCCVVKREEWRRLRVQDRMAGPERIKSEIKYSISTFAVFSLITTGVVVINSFGLNQLYPNIDDYGWPYLILSIFMMIVLHDAYFYWTHRLLHWKPLMKRYHRIHHLSTHPTAFTAFSFHPVEAAILFMIVPIISFTMPTHWVSLSVFLVYMNVFDVGVHNGYEIAPRGLLNNGFTRLFSTPTHHNLHHERVNWNFALYFNYWDRMCGTLDPTYEERFRSIKSRSRIETADARASVAERLSVERSPAAPSV